MKALEKDRTRRYETASALARDIDRYLHDETVDACPPSATYKVAKFVRRHRGAVLAVAGLLLLLVAGIIGTTLGLVRAERAQRAEAEQHRRAIADFQLARDTMDRMWTRVSPDSLTEQWSVDLVKRQLLEDALAYYQKVAEQSGDEPDVRFQISRAYHRLGDLQLYLGQTDKCVASYRTALALQQKLVDEYPDGAAYLREFAKTQYGLARYVPEAEKREAVQRVIGIQEKLAASSPEDPLYETDLAESYNRLGNLFAEQSAGQLAEQAYGKALGLLKDLSARFPEALDYPAKAAACRGNLGELYQDQRRYADAERLFRQNEALFEDLVKRYGRGYDRGKLALTECSLAEILERTGRLREAEAAARRWIEIRRGLRQQLPASVYQIEGLANGLTALAHLVARRKDYWQARAALEEAIRDLKEAMRLSGNSELLGAVRDEQCRLLEVLLALRDHAAAANTTFEFLDVAPADAATHRRAASFLASCVPLAAADKQLPADKGRQLSQQYAAQAVEQLHQAVHRGFKDADSLAKDKSLDVLRSREDYRTLELALIQARQGSGR